MSICRCRNRERSHPECPPHPPARQPPQRPGRQPQLLGQNVLAPVEPLANRPFQSRQRLLQRSRCRSRVTSAGSPASKYSRANSAKAPISAIEAGPVCRRQMQRSAGHRPKSAYGIAPARSILLRTSQSGLSANGLIGQWPSIAEHPSPRAPDRPPPPARARAARLPARPDPRCRRMPAVSSRVTG